MSERHCYVVGSNEVRDGKVGAWVARQVDGRYAHTVYDNVCLMPSNEDAERVANKLNGAPDENNELASLFDESGILN